MDKNSPICPMLMINHLVVIDMQEIISTHEVICMNEKCAWWLEDKQRCAIAVIGGKK